LPSNLIFIFSKNTPKSILLSKFYTKGQERLRDLRVLIIGAGGLGCPVAMYLAAAGVGRIGIVDHDVCFYIFYYINDLNPSVLN
jgi:hypothetical protein